MRAATQDCGNQDSSPEEAKGEKAGFCLWGEATRALMDRVDIVRDLDQRRLAASRYWQRLQVHGLDMILSVLVLVLFMVLFPLMSVVVCVCSSLLHK